MTNIPVSGKCVYKFYRTISIVSLTLLISVLFYADSSAQKNGNIQNTYIEFWGNTGLFSMNYDYGFHRNLSVRLGVMGEPKSDLENPFNSFGIVSTANLLIGPASHKLEVGSGGYLEIDQGDNTENLFFTSTVGYRFQGVEGGWIFRAGFTPAFNPDEFNWRFGISIGRVFRY